MIDLYFFRILFSTKAPLSSPEEPTNTPIVSPCSSEEPKESPQKPLLLPETRPSDVIVQPLNDLFRRSDGQSINSIIILLKEISQVLGGLTGNYCNEEFIVNVQISVSKLIDGLLQRNDGPLSNLVDEFVGAISGLQTELSNNGSHLSFLDDVVGGIIQSVKNLPGSDGLGQTWTYQGLEEFIHNDTIFTFLFLTHQQNLYSDD